MIQGKLVAVWQAPDAAAPWLPTEFMLGAYVTRILVAGRSGAVSAAVSRRAFSWLTYVT